MSNTTLTTPRGVAVWPKLREPDFKFDTAGALTVKLRIPTAEAAKMIEMIDEAIVKKHTEEAKAAKGKRVKRCDPPYEHEMDEDGNETGNVLFKFKQKAQITSRKNDKTYKITIPHFNAKGRPTDVEYGSGSIMKIAYEVVPFFVAAVGAGVTLRPNAVQVIEPKMFAQRDASGFGFGEEDGYDDDAAGATVGDEDDAPFDTEDHNTSGADF